MDAGDHRAARARCAEAAPHTCGRNLVFSVESQYQEGARVQHHQQLQQANHAATRGRCVTELPRDTGNDPRVQVACPLPSTVVREERWDTGYTSAAWGRYPQARCLQQGERPQPRHSVGRIARVTDRGERDAYTQTSQCGARRRRGPARHGGRHVDSRSSNRCLRTTVRTPTRAVRGVWCSVLLHARAACHAAPTLPLNRRRHVLSGLLAYPLR